MAGTTPRPAKTATSAPGLAYRTSPSAASSLPSSPRGATSSTPAREAAQLVGSYVFGFGGALRGLFLSGFGGALRAPRGPVAAALASSLRAPSRPLPPHEGPIRRTQARRRPR